MRASKVELAQRLYDLIDKGATARGVLDRLTKSEGSPNGRPSPTAEAIAQFYAKYSVFDTLRVRTSRVYAEEFSATELSQLIEFYQSPAGSKVLNVRSVVDSTVIASVQAIMSSHREEFADMIRRAAEKRSPPEM